MTHTELKYRKLSGYKYVLDDAFSAHVPELVPARIETDYFAVVGGELTVFKGYAWDGASGPTLDTKSTLAASLVHDVLYQCIRSGILSANARRVADEVLHRLMLEEPAKFGWWAKIRANYYFLGVRLFGGSAASPRKTEPQNIVYTA